MNVQAVAQHSNTVELNITIQWSSTKGNTRTTMKPDTRGRLCCKLRKHLTTRQGNEPYRKIYYAKLTAECCISKLIINISSSRLLGNYLLTTNH